MGNTRNRIVVSVGILVVLAMLAVLAAADTSVNAEDTSTGILLKSKKTETIKFQFIYYIFLWFVAFFVKQFLVCGHSCALVELS